MGIDAVIHFKTKDGKEPTLERDLPCGYSISNHIFYECEDSFNNYSNHGNTPPLDKVKPDFSIDTYERFYGIGYERGSWPNICATLMILFASEDVTNVWYNGDCSEYLREITINDVLELSRHFMENGERPYRRN